MKKNNNLYYISSENKNVKILNKYTSFSDIHRGLIFNNIEDISKYFSNIYGTILDENYYTGCSIFDNSLLDEKLYKYYRLLKKYKYIITRNKHKILRYDFDWKRLEKINQEHINKSVERLFDQLEYQEKIAEIWEKRTGRDFSPFTRQIYTELNGSSSYTKEWEDVQKLIEEWRIKDNKYTEELNNISLLYKNKLENMLDSFDKKKFYNYESMVDNYETLIMENKYKLIRLTEFGKENLNTYSLKKIPRDKIKRNRSGYNLLILQDDKIERVVVIYEKNSSYKFVSSKGRLFTNNIKIIIEEDFDGEEVELKPYYSFHQTKTTKSSKVTNL